MARPIPIDLTGQRYGLLTVIEPAERVGGRTAWRCRCDCGRETVVRSNFLRRGNTRSCGHLQRAPRHGGASTPLYRIWNTMLDRCTNQNRKRYADWGGRGIRVCDEWYDFAQFRADVGERPSPSHSLDRWPDNDGDYRPGNVRWATPKEQAENSRPKKGRTFITHNGETLSVTQWSEKTGIPTQTISLRIQRGWPIEMILDPAKYTRSLKRRERLSRSQPSLPQTHE